MGFIAERDAAVSDIRSETLYRVIAAVGSSPDLDQVLAGIVDALTEATDCHACFIYMRNGERLRLRAASPVYARFIDHLEWTVGEGLTGWVARNNRAAFIREDAMTDPRMKYVPELEEERFQSMVAVPVPSRQGGVIGVVVLHTVAPREFDEGTLSFLEHTASLVAGAIENARLFEEARRRVDALTALSRLSQQISAASAREPLYRVACAGIRATLGAERCEIYLTDGKSGRLNLVAAEPADAPDRTNAPIVSVVLSTGDEELGVLTVTAAGDRFPPEEADFLLRAVGNHLAVALKKTELIERLTVENVVRDLFESLAAGRTDVVEDRARAGGFDLRRPHVAVHADAVATTEGWPAVAERLEAGLRRLRAGALCDTGRSAVRALVPVDADVDALRTALDALGAAEGAAIGMSGIRQGAADGRRSLREAADAARITAGRAPQGGALAYADLGAYRYLVHVPPAEAPRDRYWDAVETLLDYDERRRAELVTTLEVYLAARARTAPTARQLYIHANTLRQRLARIQRLSGLDLASEDLLSLELAIKLGRLRRAAQRAEQ
jgi:putative methionine-R-sulfoxide reductase with GAF domain